MDRPLRDPRQHNGITLRGLSQPTFATKSAPLRRVGADAMWSLSGEERTWFGHRVSVTSDPEPIPPQAAAFFRFASSRASTKVTVASIEGWLRPFCLAMSCTSLSARSIFGVPFCKARAAEAGRDRPFAAAAYFSNGTRSFGLAPSLTQSSFTKLYTERDSSRLE